MKNIQYSIIIPVYNSEKSIGELINHVITFFEKNSLTVECILVNDNSKDQSWQRILELKQQYGELVIGIKLAKNFGQHNALLCGLSHAQGAFAITMDDDLQVYPEEITRLIETQKNTDCDAVYGIFAEKKHSGFRNFGSKIVGKIFRDAFGAEGNLSALRMIRQNTYSQMCKHKQHAIVIDGLLHWYTNNIQRVEVTHHPRKYGQSNYTLSRMLRLMSNILFNFTTIPLRLVVYVGFLFTGLSIFSLLIFLGFAYLGTGFQTSANFIFGSLLSCTAIIILMMGIIGIYIERLFAMHSEKPQYAIREVI